MDEFEFNRKGVLGSHNTWSILFPHGDAIGFVLASQLFIRAKRYGLPILRLAPKGSTAVTRSICVF